MDNAALLSPTDINMIRRYVQTKFAPLPDGRRAEIVADAIRRALGQRLPDLPDELKSRMVDRLISRCLLGENRDVRTEDVFDLAAEFGEDGETALEPMLEPILRWANERTPGRWSSDQLATRLNRTRGAVATLNPPPLSPAQVIPGASPHPAKRGFASGSRALALLLGLALLAGSAAWLSASLASRPNPAQELAQSAPEPIARERVPDPDVGMPRALRYADIDVAALQAYLESRDSLLAQEPYFGAIVDAAREYDIHPHLLFAITGQEQGFVPKSGKDSRKIANNPFNVGHSWMEYNTDISDSTGIAARLLVKLAKSRPAGADPFAWFNRTYAEDPLWSVGVSKIFNQLNGLTGKKE